MPALWPRTGLLPETSPQGNPLSSLALLGAFAMLSAQALGHTLLSPVSRGHWSPFGF